MQVNLRTRFRHPTYKMPHIVHRSTRNILITGGAGFIGCNLAAYLLAHTDARIVIYDDLSAPGARANLDWLRAQSGPGRLEFTSGDLRHGGRLRGCVRNADEIYHLAFACTANAKADAEVNSGGTLNVLDAARASGRHPLVVYISTGDIYQAARDLPVRPGITRFLPLNTSFAGIAESSPANYEDSETRGCGVADRAMQDYSRLYGLRTVVLRVDTVAGARQLPTNQHGWIARMVEDVLAGRPVTLHDSGRSTHEVLHVDDMVNAILAARAYIDVAAGRAYNVGGGEARSISEMEMVRMIERICHVSADVHHAPASGSRIPLYFSNARAFIAATGWHPRHTIEQAVREAAAFWHATRTVTRSRWALQPAQVRQAA